MVPVHHRTAKIDGMDVFYRDAGPSDAPAVVPLHCFPSSSFMFRELIPLLADRYRVIASDHIAYGSPCAARTTSRRSSARVATYMDGFGERFWAPLFAYAKNPGPETEPGVRQVLRPETTRWQFYHGVAAPTLVSPDGWQHAQNIIDRPGNDRIQLHLFEDYKTNLPLYPKAQQYFRDSKVPLLAVWGRNDEIFIPAGATAFRNDLPDAEIHLLDAGHFALESHLDVIAGYIRGFLGRTVS